MNTFRQLLASAGHRAPVGTWIMSASPIVAEAVGHAGFEWGVLDMEHTPLDMMEIVHMLQALSATRLVPVVRVPWNDTVGIKRVLDAGATTLLVPFVQSADEAAHAVAATRYPPQGRRGMAGMSRASKFGTTPNYLTSANEHVGLIVQLETPHAIERLEQIARVDGVDALFIGPGDLSATMGHVGQLLHPEVVALTTHAVQRAKTLGKPIGTVGGTPEAVAQYRAIGFDFVAIASDLGLLMRSSQTAIAALAALTGESASSPPKTSPQPQGAY
ncbi:HpcH/HpaI aldolase family protein [Piscinibacter sp.]|uniref:HpcH/HpaI aldolase family protein n=1 Tax=Piscinibacter sp. TaxID=1903157 RepID=UPI002C6C5E01|nr:aldolase/citrate lyase family protein [Albitalea sp.]HUG21108.1 aldolase/citrate lyase family protein [Albitalea sp.]